MPNDEIRRVEVITGVARRRYWPAHEKLRIIEESLAPGESASVAALAGAAAEAGDRGAGFDLGRTVAALFRLGLFAVPDPAPGGSRSPGEAWRCSRGRHGVRRTIRPDRRFAAAVSPPQTLELRT